jgi:hypothetical protein
VNEVGDRLASLIATLRDPAAAEAATGARRTYLDVWRCLDLVMLGGGLMKGVVGEGVAARTGAVLAADGVDPPVLEPLSVTSISASELPASLGLALTGLADHQTEAPTEVIFSVASYVHGGRPVRDNASMYEQLDPGSMESSFGIPVRLIHDGSAAWRGIAGDARSAVIMLGTWVGVGIGPHQMRLCSYSRDFAIHGDGAKPTADAQPLSNPVPAMEAVP